MLTNTGNNTVVQDTNKSNKEDVIQPLKDPNSEVRAGIVMPYTLKNLQLKILLSNYYSIFYQ